MRVRSDNLIEVPDKDLAERILADLLAVKALGKALGSRNTHLPMRYFGSWGWNYLPDRLD
jgi:hypothetical protein